MKLARVSTKRKVQRARNHFFFTMGGLKFLIVFVMIFSKQIRFTEETFEECPPPCSCGNNGPPLFYLDCSAQGIESPSEIDYPTDIYRLHLSNNHIRIVPRGAFRTLRFLSYLTLSKNLVETLEEGCFEGAYNLNELSLSGNRIVNVDEVHKLSQLKTLFLSSNLIENFAQKETGRFTLVMTRLYLTKNDLFRLRDIRHSISWLEVQGNRLTVFDAHEMKNAAFLTRLNIAENFLTYIPDLRNMSRLEALDLSGNRIHTLHACLPDTIESIWLLRMKRLSALSITCLTSSLSIHVKSKSSLLGLEQLQGVSILEVKGTRISNNFNFMHLPEMFSLSLNACTLTDEFVISMSRMPNLKYLTLTNNQLKNIAVSIEVPGGSVGNQTEQPIVERLILDNNHLTDISFVNLLPKLTILRAQSNKVRHIAENDVTNISTLRVISLAYNEIVSLQGLRSLPDLIEAYFANNRIKTIHPDTFSDCARLQYLGLNANDLESFVLHPALTPSVLFVNLANNRFVHLDADSFSNAQKLLELNLTKCGLQSIELSPIPTLRVLILPGNHFNRSKHVNLESFPNLIKLDMSENPIESADMIKNSRLSSLIVRNCKLRNLSFLGNTTTHENNSKALSSIDIEGNEISDLSPLLGNRIVDYFKAANNQIRQIPPTFFNLEHYDLSGNRVGRSLIGPTDSCEKLSVLNLKDNLIVFISADYFISCNKLVILDLSVNPLNNIGHAVLPKDIARVSLDFSYSGLTYEGINEVIKDRKVISLRFNNVASFDNEPNAVIMHSELLNIFLGYNHLKKIPKIDCRRLITLMLNHNGLKEVSGSVFSSLRLLKMLDLSNNQLREITSDMFAHTYHLNQIFLEDNQISRIAEGSFRALHQLQSLTMSNNILIKLGFNNLPRSSFLTHFDFSNNSWCCSCQSSAELRLWLIASDVDSVICQSPVRFQGTDLSSITEKHLCSRVRSDGEEAEEEEASGFDFFDDLFMPELVHQSEGDVCDRPTNVNLTDTTKIPVTISSGTSKLYRLIYLDLYLALFAFVF